MGVITTKAGTPRNGKKEVISPLIAEVQKIGQKMLASSSGDRATVPSFLVVLLFIFLPVKCFLRISTFHALKNHFNSSVDKIKFINVRYAMKIVLDQEGNK
jgi:hypothetical protein